MVVQTLRQIQQIFVVNVYVWHHLLSDSLEVQYSKLRYLVDDIQPVVRSVSHLVPQHTAHSGQWRGLAT